MKPSSSFTATLTTGFALFSMFFGAGNIVFPLAMGREAQSQNIFGISGLILTAVLLPLLGVIAMSLFNGNHKHFFERIGKVPGFLVLLMIICLIGPFGALPRTILVAHATFQTYWPDVSLSLFSLASIALIFSLTFKKNRILDILGCVLTPFLLICLLVIIVKGFFGAPELPESSLSPAAIFFEGVVEGYQTMDFLGAFLFTSVVLACLEESEEGVRIPHKNYRNAIFMTLKAGAIGAFLLAFVYLGFSFLAASYSDSLASAGRGELLGALSLSILGNYAGPIAIIAVALACLTTAIALSVTFAEFLHYDIFGGKLPYIPSLLLTLALSFFISTFQFEGIAAFLLPILKICYPALIVLTLVNIAHKLYHFQPVKIPVALTLAATCSYYLLA